MAYNRENDASNPYHVRPARGSSGPAYGEYDDSLRQPIATPAGNIRTIDPGQYFRGRDARVRGDARDAAAAAADEGDYEGAAQGLLRYDPEQAAVYDAFGDKQAARAEKTKERAYNATVTPLIAEGKYSDAEKVTADAGRPMADIEKIRAFAARADKDQIEQLRAINEKSFRALQGIEAMPIDQRQAAYAELRAAHQADGLAKTWPPAYTPQFVADTLKAAQTAETIFQTAIKAKTTLTPEEAAREGFQPGSVVQRGGDNALNVVQEPAKPASGPGNGKPYNEYASKSAGFAKRMIDATDQMRKLSEGGVDWDKVWAINQSNGATDLFGKAQKERAMLAAMRSFIEAQRRADSGAAIAKDEWASARLQYFPVPGDGPDVVEVKRQNMKTAIDAMKAQSQGAYSEFFPNDASSPSDGEGQDVGASLGAAAGGVYGPGDVPTITTQEQYNALKPGQPYKDARGVPGVK